MNHGPRKGGSGKPPSLPEWLFDLHPTLDVLPTLIYVKDRDLRVVSVNAAYCTALGVERSFLLGQTTWQFLGDAGPESDRIDREVISSGRPQLGIVESLPMPDGLRWVVTDKAPILSSDGEVVGLLGTSIDITEWKIADDESRATQEQLASLTANMAGILWTMDLEFRTTVVAPTIERMLGFTPDERARQSLEEMVTPDSVARVREELQRQMGIEAAGNAKPDRTLVVDIEYYRKDGSTLWTENVLSPLRDAEGTLIGMLGVARDITARRTAERALHESEQLLRATEIVSRVGGWSYDVAADRIVWTRGVFDIYELPEDWTSPDVEVGLAGYPGEAQVVIASAFREAVENGVPYDLELPFVTARGARKWVRTVGNPQFEDGRVVRVTGNIVDVTASHEATSALRESETRYRQLFDESVAAILLVSSEDRILAANPAWYRMFGYSPEDLSSLHPEALYADPSERARFLETMARDGGLTNDETRFRKKDGSVMHCLRSVSARRDPNGRVTGYQTTFHDITDLKLAERALRESEARYRTLFEQSVDAINLVSEDGKLLEANPAWFSLFGYTPEDRASFDAGDVYVDPDGRARFLDLIARQGAVDDEIQFRRKDGSMFECHRFVVARRDAAGHIVSFQTVFHDVTEQRNAQRAMLQSEAKYRALFELSKDAAYIVSSSGWFLEVNDAWIDMFGYTREEVAGLRAEDVYEDPKLREECFLPAMTKNGAIANWEIRFRKKDGTVMDCLCNVVARRDESGAVISYQGLVRDITSEKSAERVLRESERRFRTLSENLEDGIVRLDLSLRIVYANAAAGRLLTGQSSSVCGTFSSIGIPDAVRSLWEEALDEVFRSGMMRKGQCEFDTPEGRILLDWRIIPERGVDGSIVSLLVSLRDVTDLRNAQEQLRELAVRMQNAREEERASISRDLHDHFGQELTALQFDLESVARVLGQGQGEALSRIRRAVELVDGMSHGLRQVISEMRPGMLDDLGLCAALEWQASQFEERSGIVCALNLDAADEGLSPVLATALFRVAQELLDDVARYAEATRVAVKLSADQDYLTLTVEDDGRGIAADQLNSTDSLGLLGIQERVRACGGNVAIRGARGEGTTVVVRVPLRHSITRE